MMNSTLVRLGAVAVLCIGASIASAGVIADFETGTLEGWGADAQGAATLSVVAGGSGGSNYALRIHRPTGAWANTTTVDLSAAKWTDLAANTTLSFDYKATAGPGNDVPGWWAQFAPILNSQTGGWDQGPNPDAVLDGAWHTQSWVYPAQAPTSGTYGQLFFVVQGGADATGMTVYIDNITVSGGDIPEPASLSLLGLGSLALLRRRTRRA
jgi:hypothetical protein